MNYDNSDDMAIGHHHRIGYFVLCTLLLGTFFSCANRGIGPQGGPKDSIPPVPLKSEPEVGVLNFHGDRIEVTFNEYIQLDNIATNLLMSPPQQNPPEVKARGKRLLVQFKDSLHDSTTYTIDFGAAVCDYREKVPLRGYSFYFSTGDEIDTLDHIGRVYDAATLNPVSGMLVGIHRDLADSAFVKAPFLRIAKTDSAGYFRIGNIHPGAYRLYAVDDVSRDYRLTVGEALAFMDSTVTVYPVPDSLRDSVPLSVLFLFKEQQQKLYLQRAARELQHMIQWQFSASPDSALTWRVMRPSELDTARSDSDWVDPTPFIHTYSTPGNDTVTLWLTDSIAIRQDTIAFELRYRRTDSVFNLEWYVDTLTATWRAPKLSAKVKEAEDRKNRNRRLEIKSNARKGFDVYDTLRLTITTPLAAIDTQAMHLYELVDTLRRAVPFALLPSDSLPMKLLFDAALKPEGNYELKLDSGALTDVYGTSHIAGTYGLLVKSLADYSTLRVRLKPFEPKARIQLLNKNDEVVRELPAAEDGAFFENLKPDTYYLRLYIDANQDGRWTTGSWEFKRQPEAIYYYPNRIQTKSNWDFEEEWDYTAVPQMKSKPAELIKSAPKKKK